ncbi:MAG: methionine ABC transporter ATP-binding protein [Verrucomicrobia bacterium]|nr:methionine ABC transporter ATP-binding protein [Verrucomicrobiota bacterium]
MKESVPGLKDEQPYSDRLQPADKAVAVEFRSVSKSFRSRNADVAALFDINLQIETGEVFGVIGHSGAGKSTLLRLVNLLEHPTSGELRAGNLDLTTLKGAELRSWRRQVGMIFQHFNLLSSKTVWQNIALPLRLAGTPKTGITPRVTELLTRFDLQPLAHRYPAQLSGGQKQRVGIARALACHPKILLCDEATSALDPETTLSVLELLASVNREFGLTIILITHEMDVIRRVCDRVAVLADGRIVEIGSVADLFLHPQHPATRRLVFEAEQINEQEQEQNLSRVAGHPVLRLTFRGEATYEPLLGSIARETGVDYSILSGRIDRIKGVAYGQLTLALVGGNVSAALQRFSANNVHVEKLS